MATAWVTESELRAQMADPNLLWSPWFRVIARELLFPWWSDLKRALKQPAFAHIMRFDAPVEHRKAGGCHDGPAGTELADIAAAEGALKWDSDERRSVCLRSEREARRRGLLFER